METGGLRAAGFLLPRPGHWSTLPPMQEAMLYTQEAGRKVRCRLCRHGCLIAEGQHGICNVRMNDGGTLYSIFYGKPIAMAVDPIEKKPFFHYKPGSTAFSIATPGCTIP